MTTTKTTKKNVNNNAVSNKKSATTKRTIPVTDGNETKVMCPVCGTEFAIGEHEHTVKNAMVIGADSGLGNVYLPVSKRGEALQAAGIDTSKYFSIHLPTGVEQLMTYDENGTPVAVKDDDPVMQQIVKGGTVPNRNLFRRWVMSQVFHWLRADDQACWLKRHGYIYTWKMLVEELRVQAKLYGRDMENFNARNRWYNSCLACEMARDYIDQLYDSLHAIKPHKCKGVPYIKFERQNIFVADIEKKILQPLQHGLFKIVDAKTPATLYEAVRKFYGLMAKCTGDFKQFAGWKDAYKGAGAYFTMQNLLRFHGCKFPRDNSFYQRNVSGLAMLEQAAVTYADGEGWRLFGLMKQMIEENGINIAGKMQEWAKVKRCKK